MALPFKPAVELLAADPDAAADPDRRDLAVGDQLVGSAAGYPQHLRYLRDLQLLVLLFVHPHLLRSVAVAWMLRRLVACQYRKRATLPIPGTRTAALVNG